jgi:hypothetical protein
MVDAHIPHYPSVARAVHAIRQLIDYYQKK